VLSGVAEIWVHIERLGSLAKSQVLAKRWLHVETQARECISYSTATDTATISRDTEAKLDCTDDIYRAQADLGETRLRNIDGAGRSVGMPPLHEKGLSFP
jgi:hypothetical protein